jgi:hypothetical protein
LASSIATNAAAANRAKVSSAARSAIPKVLKNAPY